MWCMWACGFNSLVVYFYVNTRDIREEYMTTRSELYTEDIRSLGFRDVREGVTWRRLILWSLEYIVLDDPNLDKIHANY